MAIEPKNLQSPLSNVALNDYARKYGVEDILQFRNFKLQDVLNTIIQTERNREAQGKSGYGILKRLGSLLSFVDRYAEAFDVLVQISGGGINPAALVWGLLRVLLETASSAAHYLTNLLDLLEDVGAALSLYTEYETMFWDHPRFQRALINVYADILEILGKARKVLKKNGIWLAGRCILRNFAWDFREQLSLIRRHSALLQDEITLAHRTQLHEYIKGQNITPKEDTQSKHREAILRWLNPVDSLSRLGEINYIRHSGTCSWLLEHPTYTSWKGAIKSSAIWICGPPGVGKTVLSSAIMADITNTQADGSIATCFFCDAGNAAALSSTSLYASLIHQVLEKTKACSLPSALSRAYEKSLQFGRASISAADSPDKLLREVFSAVKEVFIIVDGLDEMKSPIESISTLLQMVWSLGTIYVGFISRDISSIRRMLGDLPRIEVSAADVQSDITSYIKASSKKLQIEDITIRNEFVVQVSLKADGMFLWAHMVLENLSTATSIAEMRHMLNQCPPGLKGIYMHFLSGLSQEPTHRQNLGREVLNWACCATRPLKISELEMAVWTNSSKNTIEDERRPFRSVLLEICNPFIRLSTDGEHIRPVHQSVREFLLNEANRVGLTPEVATFIVSEQETHGKIATTCLKYLRLSAQPSKSPFNDLTHYAMLSWCYHTLRSVYKVELAKDVAVFLSQPELRQKWLFYILFRNDKYFPFQRSFDLQAELRTWLKSAQKPELPTNLLQATDWSIDVLELLMKIQDFKTEADHEPNILGNDGISYFDKMMVVRGLARRLTQNGRLAEAIETLESRRATNVESSNNISISTLLNTLGILYDQQNRYQLAFHIHKKAFSCQEAHLGPENPETLWTVNEIGRMYRHLGLLAESEQMHQRALEVLTRSLSADHPERIWTLNTLATTYRKQCRPMEALNLHKEAYEVRCESLGADHAHTLWSCGDVAKCYRDLNLFDDSLIWYRRAYEGRVRVLRPENPDIYWSLNDLGVVLADMGRLEDAIESQEQAVEAQRKYLGEDHSHTRWTKEVLESLRTINK